MQNAGLLDHDDFATALLKRRTGYADVRAAWAFESRAILRLLNAEDPGRHDSGPHSPERGFYGDPATTEWAACLRSVLESGAMRTGWTGNETMIRNLYEDVAAHPSFAGTTEIVRDAISASMITGDIVKFRPILVCGATGSEMDDYAKAIATTLRTTCVNLSVGREGDDRRLLGVPMSETGARMGDLAKSFLMDTDRAAPLFVIDGMDARLASYGKEAFDVFLAALKDDGGFVDRYLGFPVSLHLANWLFRIDDKSGLTSEILGRTHVVDLEQKDGISLDESSGNSVDLSTTLIDGSSPGIRPGHGGIVRRTAARHVGPQGPQGARPRGE